MISSTYPTLAEQAFSGRTTALRNGVLAIAGSLALWLSAKLQVPFYPVPMTMQTFVVLVIGTSFGWRLGAATVALYLIEGALGLPVFAGTPEKGIGLAYMVGPTGGYLLGYLPAAALCGFLASHGWDRRIVTTALTMLLGTVVIYAFGLSWLGTVLGWDKPILAWGLTPFVLGDPLKLALATAVLPLAWKFVGRTRNGDR
ncbi:MAG: biotin transporter BioY [Mesorhizobium sp.]|uniref:biotin transporter BioY n=1 Tax=Mesorhizobium sp. TaxID=1871066 RepID=UPI000FE938D4|nr:biotin transporter BioY [Mesorhizobium sp.]RWL81356.1 MAG: biotin transporter BioY [Mesorhizobium sp.]